MSGQCRDPVVLADAVDAQEHEHQCHAEVHRLVSLMTAEAVDELGLKIGDEAIAVVKATNVIVEIPSPRENRS